MGSDLTGTQLHSKLGQIVHTYVPLSPSSISWYWSKDGDVVLLGRWPQAWGKVMAAYHRLTACTPRSALGPTLCSEYGEFYLFTLYCMCVYKQGCLYLVRRGIVVLWEWRETLDGVLVRMMMMMRSKKRYRQRGLRNTWLSGTTSKPSGKNCLRKRKHARFVVGHLCNCCSCSGWPLVQKTWKCQGFWQLSGKCLGFYQKSWKCHGKNLVREKWQNLNWYM